MNAIKKHWRKHAKLDAEHPIPQIICNDGFTMSVQAGSGWYCTPCEALESGNYTAWEIGYPSEKEPLIMKYAEDETCPIGTVYGYVLTDIVNAVIAKHGGVKE